MVNVFKALILFSFLIGNCFAIGQKLPVGGGEHITENIEHCLSDENRLEIQNEINKNIEKLKRNGKISLTEEKKIVSFNWPVVKDPQLTFNGYYGIVNFVDQDNSSGVGDYNCTERSYNGHQGTDISTWPFPWYQYDNDFVSIVAAEAGVIVFKQDGNADNSCSWVGGSTWNAVFVQHSDGSVAWYGHLKLNGLTSKEVGESVEQGEFLGFMASSGYSTGPHLHFEIYNANAQLIDPFSGECNALNEESWWSEQQDFYQPTILAALTHSAVPELGCPSENEIPHFSNEFNPGETIYFVPYYRDQLANSVSTYTVRQPNGVTYSTWTHFSEDTYSLSYWYWTGTLDENDPAGTWTFEVEFEDQIVIHEFELIGAIGIEEYDSELDIIVDPNPSDNVINIRGVRVEKSNFSIWSVDGRLVVEESTLNGPIDISHLDSGTYFVLLISEDQIISKRFIRL